jgi:hypothetical protein
MKQGKLTVQKIIQEAVSVPTGFLMGVALVNLGIIINTIVIACSYPRAGTALSI